MSSVAEKSALQLFANGRRGSGGNQWLKPLLSRNATALEKFVTGATSVVRDFSRKKKEKKRKKKEKRRSESVVWCE